VKHEIRGGNKEELGYSSVAANDVEEKELQEQETGSEKVIGHGRAKNSPARS
jgi:hypothetical protein